MMLAVSTHMPSQYMNEMFVYDNCFYFGIRLEVMKWSSLWKPQMMI